MLQGKSEVGLRKNGDLGVREIGQTRKLNIAPLQTPWRGSPGSRTLGLACAAHTCVR
jgi:hypothetical protein